MVIAFSEQQMSSATKKKEDDKERKFLGLLTYKLEYDFEKNSVIK